MSTFELQTFHSGKWAVDSYFDDRDLAMSEAEKLDVSGRHSGVRVLEEDFEGDNNRSKVRVIFSKMKGVEGTDDWRVKIQRTSQKTSASRAGNGGTPAARRRRSPPKKKSNLYLVIIIAIVLLLGGVAAMIGLQEFAKMI